MDLFNYFRRETTEVNIGAVPLGGPNSIRVQSMTNTSTQDTQACVEQAKRIVDAGGEYVRLTTQGIKEAENLMNSIYDSCDLSARGYHKLLKVARTIADIDGSEYIMAEHICEASGYRMV